MSLLEYLIGIDPVSSTSPKYWKLYPIIHNWCVYNHGYMTPYFGLYCYYREMNVDYNFCSSCQFKSLQMSLF